MIFVVRSRIVWAIWDSRMKRCHPAPLLPCSPWMIRTAVVQAKRTMPRKSILGSIQDGVTRAVFGKEEGTKKTAFYDLVDKDMDGNEVSMGKFKGDVLCVVNVASK